MVLLGVLAQQCTQPRLLIPEKIVETASWGTINDAQWELVYKDSPVDREPREFYNSIIKTNVTSRVTAWVNQFKETAVLLIFTPNITVAGFSKNPFTNESFNPLNDENDEKVLRELGRRGGGVARQELGITFDLSMVELIFQESVTAQMQLGITMKGSRFLAQTPQGEVYVTLLRGVHGQDLIVLVTVAQSPAASREADQVASLINHPAAEPHITSKNPVECTVFATREGLVGHTTANGHVIGSADRFVALPSRSALASLGGTEYQVRVTHGDRSVVVPVWDVGPWNIEDNYWDPSNKRQWPDLPQCLPQAQTAYQQGYNNGRSGLGRQVLNPAGIDLSEGVWSDLGMADNGWVAVEFLWTTR